MSKIKVSILCVTYNHAEFIRQTLDGFIMQKTDFPFEVLIHDDASTDGTADIIREYAEKYPDIIKPILQTENQWSKGVLITQKYLYPKIQGEYVAVCDGDDCWTDSCKLQKQADFLDSHLDYAICFHPVSVVYNNTDSQTIWPSKREIKHISLNTLLYGNFIPNCAVMYRWQPNGLNIMKDWPKNIYPGDWFVHLLHAKHGKIGFVSDVMAMYRRHANGISFVSESGIDSLHTKYGIQELNFYLAVEKQIAPDTQKYHEFVCTKACEILNTYLKNKDFNSAIDVLKACPDLILDDAKKSDIIRQYRSFSKLAILTVILLIIGIIIGIVL